MRAPSAERLQQLLADLGDDRFVVRERASGELSQLGELAAAALRELLAAAVAAEEARRAAEEAAAKAAAEEAWNLTIGWFNKYARPAAGTA